MSPFHVGTRAFRWLWSPVDAPAVKYMRAMGLNITGKTTTSELALLPVVETDLQPPTVNPWNTDFTAGGSSGGSAAAVAAGMLPIAAAADGGGSIRIPASFNHLFGFKPSFGATPNFYKPFDPVGLAVMGSVTHTVRDAAIYLDGLAGRPNRDEQVFAGACDRPPPTGLRIGLCLASPLVEVQEDIAEAVRRVAKLLEDMGHHVELVDGAHEGTLERFLPVYGRVIATTPVMNPWKLQPTTRWLRELGRTITVKQARAVTASLAEIAHDWWGDVDLMLTPTVGIDPPRVNAWASRSPEETMYAAAEVGAFTAAFNITGQPSASIPAGLSQRGLPIGAQLTARRGEDELLLSVCAELERALNWSRRRCAMASSC